MSDPQWAPPAAHPEYRTHVRERGRVVQWIAIAAALAVIVGIVLAAVL